MAKRLDARSAHTREKIELAALEVFAAFGFEGASTRQIAERAGVKQQLLAYHYENKSGLWKATADRLFSAWRQRLEKRLAGLEGVDEQTQTRLLIREYLAFCADNPALARFMMQVGGQESEHLSWLFENHTRAFLERIADLIDRTRRAQGLPEVDIRHLTYVLTGASAMFSQRAEYELITGNKVNSPETVSDFSDLMTGLLIGGADAGT